MVHTISESTLRKSVVDEDISWDPLQNSQGCSFPGTSRSKTQNRQQSRGDRASWRFEQRPSRRQGLTSEGFSLFVSENISLFSASNALYLIFITRFVSFEPVVPTIRSRPCSRLPKGPRDCVHVYNSTMEWIYRWITPHKAPSFRIRTKLNSEEATRRLIKIRQGLELPKQQVIDLCRVVERDGKLEEQLGAMDRELDLTVDMLEGCYVGEREYLGNAVLVLEELLCKIKNLLLQVALAAYSGQGIPDGCALRARGLADQLKKLRKVLIKVREAVREEFCSHVATVTAGSTWLAKIWGPKRISKSAIGDGICVEEHWEREHLFTGIAWRHRQRCTCLDYC